MHYGTIENTKIELTEYFDFVKNNMVFKEMEIQNDKVYMIFLYKNYEHHIIYFFKYNYLTVKMYKGIINLNTVLIKKDGDYNIKEMIYDYFLYRDDIIFEEAVF